MDYRQHAEQCIINYQNLGIMIREDPEFSFLYPGSVKFQTPQQFIERSMIAQPVVNRKGGAD